MASYYGNKNITSDAFFGQIISYIFSEGLDKAKEIFIDISSHYDPNLDSETAANLIETIETDSQMVSLISSLDGMPEHVKKYVNSPEMIEKDLLSDGFQTTNRKVKKSINSNNNPRSNNKSRHGSGMSDKNEGDNRYNKISSNNRYSNKNGTAPNKGIDGNKRRNNNRTADMNTECRYCHEMGHYIKDCPKLSDKKNGDSSRNKRTPKRFSDFPSTSEPSDDEQHVPVKSYEEILNEDFPAFDENNKVPGPLPDKPSFSDKEVILVSKTIESLYPSLNVPKNATRKVAFNNKNPPIEEDKVVIDPPVSTTSVWASNKGYICSKLVDSQTNSAKIEDKIQLKDGFDSDEDEVNFQVLK